MATPKADLISLSDYAYRRTRARIEGLTDAEYFWQPVADCWTISQDESGAYRADRSDSVEIPPFTTIAWRMWHLAECYGSKRNPQWLGVKRAPAGFEKDDPAPGTAAAAIAELERAYALWADLLDAVDADSLWEPFGPIAGPYADSDKASLILHQLDEQIHHGAELGVLRDLYRHTQ